MIDILQDMQPLIDWLYRPKNWQSIILHSNLQMADKRTCFLDVGDKVKVNKGKLVDCADGVPTHEVVQMWGNNIHDVKVQLINLETDNLLTIEIKKL